MFFKNVRCFQNNDYVLQQKNVKKSKRRMLNAFEECKIVYNVKMLLKTNAFECFWM